MPDAMFLIGESDPIAHVVDWVQLEVGGWWVFTSSVGNLLLSAIIMVVGFTWVARRVATGPESQGHDRYVTRNPFAHMIEVICVYLKEEVARPLLGDRTERLMPFLWTLFFFVLINNLLGLLPLRDILHMGSHEWNFFGGTATQNLYVTAALALISGIVFNVEAVRRLGFRGFAAHLTGGAPWYLGWFIFIMELAGQIIIKPGALAIRLFANMTGGHTLLAALLGFTTVVLTKGLIVGGTVTVVSVAGAVAVMFLELLVGFIQAFIFMFLTALFISLMDHHEGEHEHGEAAHAH
jgi:F-type H+-transporting ATPase subunit a